MIYQTIPVSEAIEKLERGETVHLHKESSIDEQCQVTLAGYNSASISWKTDIGTSLYFRYPKFMVYDDIQNGKLIPFKEIKNSAKESVESQTSKKNPHFDLIVQYYSDPEKYDVEVKSPITKNWLPIQYPSWSADCEYRLVEKQKPKPKVTKYKVLYKVIGKEDSYYVSSGYYENWEEFENSSGTGYIFVSLIKESAKEFEVNNEA